MTSTGVGIRMRDAPHFRRVARHERRSDRNNKQLRQAGKKTANTMTDPVNLEPIPALQDSYVFHSQLPPEAAPGSDANKGGWIMGIDEAGRGRELPV